MIQVNVAAIRRRVQAKENLMVQVDRSVLLDLYDEAQARIASLEQSLATLTAEKGELERHYHLLLVALLRSNGTLRVHHNAMVAADVRDEIISWDDQQTLDRVYTVRPAPPLSESMGEGKG